MRCRNAVARRDSSNVGRSRAAKLSTSSCNRSMRDLLGKDRNPMRPVGENIHHGADAAGGRVWPAPVGMSPISPGLARFADAVLLDASSLSPLLPPSSSEDDHLDRGLDDDRRLVFFVTMPLPTNRYVGRSCGTGASLMNPSSLACPLDASSLLPQPPPATTVRCLLRERGLALRGARASESESDDDRNKSWRTITRLRGASPPFAPLLRAPAPARLIAAKELRAHVVARKSTFVANEGVESMYFTKMRIDDG